MTNKFTFTNTWTGSLTGTGHIHIFSAEVIDAENRILINVISKRWLITSSDNLFFDEVGEVNGDVAHVVSTVSGGTGIYKKAHGQLTLDGVITAEGVQFTYSGNINLAN